MNEDTIIEVTWLVSKETDRFYGKKQIKEDVIANLEILYEYDDIKSEEELQYWFNQIDIDFDKVMNFVCDMLELDYTYVAV